MILADTGPLVAVADADDRHHDSCLSLLEANDEVVVPILVVVEAAYLIERNLGPMAEAAFIRSFQERELRAEPVEPDDWGRIADLIEQYADLPLGTVDASVIAAAERLDLGTVATLDHRHFRVIRPLHTDALELLP